MLTSACGITTPEKKPPVPGGGGTGNFRCPRCNGLFTRSRTVKDHFVSCTRKYGNPQGLRWFDDESLAASRKWYLDHPPTARGEMDTEGGEEANGEEEDEEGDGDLEGMDEDQSRGLYTSA